MDLGRPPSLRRGPRVLPRFPDARADQLVRCRSPGEFGVDPPHVERFPGLRPARAHVHSCAHAPAYESAHPETSNCLCVGIRRLFPDFLTQGPEGAVELSSYGSLIRPPRSAHECAEGRLAPRTIS